MAQHEELSIPSLDLIQPGACKDAAACDKLRDAIAGECEALLMRFESEKEVCQLRARRCALCDSCPRTLNGAVLIVQLLETSVAKHNAARGF